MDAVNTSQENHAKVENNSDDSFWANAAAAWVSRPAPLSQRSIRPLYGNGPDPNRPRMPLIPQHVDGYYLNRNPLRFNAHRDMPMRVPRPPLLPNQLEPHFSPPCEPMPKMHRAPSSWAPPVRQNLQSHYPKAAVYAQPPYARPRPKFTNDYRKGWNRLIIRSDSKSLRNSNPPHDIIPQPIRVKGPRILHIVQPPGNDLQLLHPVDFNQSAHSHPLQEMTAPPPPFSTYESRASQNEPYAVQNESDSDYGHRFNNDQLLGLPDMYGKPFAPVPIHTLDRRIQHQNFISTQHIQPFTHFASPGVTTGLKASFPAAAIPQEPGNLAPEPNVKKALPQWLKDAAKMVEVKEPPSAARMPNECDDYESAAQLLTPPSDEGSPKSLQNTDVIKCLMHTAVASSGIASDPLRVPLDIQAKKVSTSILLAATDMVFEKIALDALVTARKQYISHIQKQKSDKPKFVLQLQQTSGKATVNDAIQTKEENELLLKSKTKRNLKLKDDDDVIPTDINEIINNGIVSGGIFKAPDTASAPPKDIFRVIVFVHAKEVASIPFNHSHVILGSAYNSANIIDKHPSVYSQHVALVHIAKNFYLFPLGGPTKIFLNSSIPWISNFLASSQNNAPLLNSQSSLINNVEANFHTVSSLSDSDASQIVSGGDRKVMLTEDSSAFVMGESKRVYFLNLTNKDTRIRTAGKPSAIQTRSPSSSPPVSDASEDSDKLSSDETELNASGKRSYSISPIITYTDNSSKNSERQGSIHRHVGYRGSVASLDVQLTESVSPDGHVGYGGSQRKQVHKILSTRTSQNVEGNKFKKRRV